MAKQDKDKLQEDVDQVLRQLHAQNAERPEPTAAPPFAATGLAPDLDFLLQGVPDAHANPATEALRAVQVQQQQMLELRKQQWQQMQQQAVS